MQQTDTIAAISTAWGEAGIAVVRLSGPKAIEIARTVVHFHENKSLPPARMMKLASLRDSSGQDIDRVLFVHFDGPNSYTGEDVAEIHTHGGTLVAQLCLESLLRQGARLAEPGEFTRRAFLNGRIDLSQSEAVLGIIRSRSAEALRAAARTLSGELSSFVSEIREELLNLQGSLEVDLDFPEEGAPYVEPDEVASAISVLRLSLEDLLDRCSVGLLLREGIRVALTGRPNVGKSSILNALLKQARAIVTALPGTTRDIIEEVITYKGVPMRLVDTAGLRRPTDEIEASGIERTKAELKRSDVCLWVLDSSMPLDDEERAYIENLQSRDHIVVLNKADKPRAVTEEDIHSISPESQVLSLSAKTGAGIDELKENIFSMIAKTGTLNSGLNVTARQLNEVRDALDTVITAEKAVQDNAGQDIVAGLIGSARKTLERLLGIEYDDALLESVFSRFCVGK